MQKITKKLLRSKRCAPGADFRSGLASLKPRRSGQLLIEMLVALGILTIGFLGVTSLLSRALGLNRVVADNYTATYLAAEGVEITKNILDGNIIQRAGWNAGFRPGNFEVDFRDRSITAYDLAGNSPRPLTFDPVNRIYGYDYAVPTPFYRTISIALGQEEVTVNSRVDWVTRGGGSFSVDLEDHFFHWR